LVEYCVVLCVFIGPISSTSRLLLLLLLLLSSWPLPLSRLLLLLLLLLLSSWPLPLSSNARTGSNCGKENERGNLEEGLHLVGDSIAIGLL